MLQTQELTAEGPDGVVRTFWYHLDESEVGEVSLYVWPRAEPEPEEEFYFCPLPPS